MTAASCLPTPVRHDPDMGRDRTTSDLFSMASSGGSSPGQERPHLLPKDLPNALKHLNDEELDRLLTAAVAEAKRRDRSLPSSAFPNASAERGHRLIDAWAAKRRSRCFQSWRHACTDCPTVRLIAFRRAESSGERGIGATKDRLIRPKAFKWRSRHAAKLSYGSCTLYFCNVKLFVDACRFTCRGETREEQVRDGTDYETRSCPHRPHSNQSKRLSRRCAGS